MKAIYAVTLAAVFVAFILDVKAVTCPPENDLDVTLIPNLNDCKTFYICNKGIPYLMECPNGLHFNSKIRVCDFPEHAQCVPGGSTPSVSTLPSSTATPEVPPTPNTDLPELEFDDQARYM